MTPSALAFIGGLALVIVVGLGSWAMPESEQSNRLLGRLLLGGYVMLLGSVCWALLGPVIA